jgi:hypothetical protein
LSFNEAPVGRLEGPLTPGDSDILRIRIKPLHPINAEPKEGSVSMAELREIEKYDTENRRAFVVATAASGPNLNVAGPEAQMAQGNPIVSPARPSGPSNVSGIYEHSRAALKDVGCAYDAWTGSLTSISLEMCYAVIAGNWLVFSSNEHNSR